MKAAVFAFAVLALAPASAMTLTSSDFRDGAELPLDHVYTRCGGRNVSPALAWSGVPKSAKTMVLTMIDMDVKPHFWSHWIVVRLPVDSTGIARGAKALPNGAIGVVSNFGDEVYDGPCPPTGSGVHHYRFTLWALSGLAGVPSDGSAAELQARLSAKAIAKAAITGWVKR